MAWKSPMTGTKVPFRVFRPDPSTLNPEDFTDEEIDHGDGGWGVSFDDGSDTEGEETVDENVPTPETDSDDSAWLTGILDEND